MIVTAAELARYCRIDTDADNTQLLTELGTAAESYLAHACGVDGSALTGDALETYKLAVKQYVLWTYDDPSGASVPVGLRQSINAIKAWAV